MARIVYSVAGEGFGHSSRSHTIGQALLDSGHDVMFVGADNSLEYLREYYGSRVKEVFGLGFAYRNGNVRTFGTIKRNLCRLPQANRINRTLFTKHLKNFKPHVVITDFEPFCALWAWRKNVPFVSIDHEHMLTFCKLRGAGHLPARCKAQLVARCYYSGAFAYIIINFFRVPLKTGNAVLAPPIVRPKAGKVKAGAGDHVLVYSTAGAQCEELLAMLAKFKDQKFIVYGFNQNSEHANCTLKKRSTDQFLTDLAWCRGVIASAGFSSISECMHLKKKMCLVPVQGQYEQIVNAHYVQKLGLGISVETLDYKAIERFLDQIDKPLPKNDRILWPNNKRFFSILSKILQRLPTPITLDTSANR